MEAEDPNQALDRDRWLAVLSDLDTTMEERDLPALSLLAIGGAAMALVHGERSTTDLDVFNDDLPQGLRDAAADVAAKHRLRTDWLNDGGKGFAPTLTNTEPHTLVFKGSRLEVVVPPNTYLLATKLRAAREQDLSDVHRLMAITQLTTKSQLIELLEAAYAPSQREVRMQYFAEAAAASFARRQD